MLYVVAVDVGTLEIYWTGNLHVPVRVPWDTAQEFRGDYRYILSVVVSDQAYLSVAAHPEGEPRLVPIPMDVAGVFMRLLTDKDRPR